MKTILALLALTAPLYAQQTLTLKSADCGDHRVIICTSQLNEGGSLHIELGKEKHLVNLAFAGPDKLSATDYAVRASVISGDGIDHLYGNLSAKDGTGVYHNGKISLTLTARSVNGVKNYTLTEGTVVIQ